jgi:hypothetical protein
VTAPTGVDVDRLRRALELVTADPDRWEQGHWFELPPAYEEAAEGHDDAPCSVARLPVDGEPGVDWTCGTTACLAGWVTFQAGHEPSTVIDHVVSPTGEVGFVRRVAQELLGLTDGQASLLFFGDNSLRDLWEYARVFTDGALEVPPAVLAEPPFAFDDVTARYEYERARRVTS